MDAGLPYDDRFQGLAVFGESGVGKSVFLTNLILRDIRHGLGVGVIDYHGDLVRNVIAGLPAERVSDIILLDLTDAEFPFGLNLCEVEGTQSIENVAATASFITHLFEVLFATGLGTTPRLLECLRALTRTLIEVSPELAMLTEIPLLFSNDTAREKVVSRLTNPAVVFFWEAYNHLTDRQKNELVESTRNKITAFTDEPLIRHIIGQGNSTVNFSRIMQEGKILLVKLSPLYEQASQLVGGAILAKLLMAGFARASLPEEARRPFMLFVDEFQRVAAASSDMKTFIHEARKFKVGLTLATQSLQNLDEGTRAAALACGNLMVFRVSGLDAGVLAKNFDATPEPTPQHLVPEPVLRPAADTISHLVHHGHSDQRLTRFAQGPLVNFERFMHEREPFAYYRWNLDKAISIYPTDLVAARQQLNEAFSSCMREQNPNVYLPPLALYILIVSQRYGWERCVDQWVRNKNKYLTDFAYRPEKFAEFLLSRLAATQQRVRWWRPLTQELTWAEGVWQLLSELRYCLRVLAKAPVFDRTGELQLKMQPRTYADQANQRANELTQMPNYCCRVRFVTSGEHVLHTRPLPPLLTGEALAARILQIKRRNWEQGYTRFYKDVEKEIRQRQDRLKTPIPEQKRRGRRVEDPPPTSA